MTAQTIPLPRTIGAPFMAVIGGVLLLCAGLFVDPRAVMQGYFGVALAVVLMPVGGLVLLFMMDLIGGAWRALLGPTVLRVAGLLPIGAVLLLPVLLAIAIDDPWQRAPMPDWPVFRVFFLQHWFIALRSVFYLGIWFFLLRGVHLQSPRRAGVAAGGLIVLVTTITLAAVDWAMSLTPEFTSSIYGLLLLTQAVLTTLALALILYAHRSKSAHPPMLGALLLTALLLWAYMHAMQFIIVWAADRPDEIVWYIVRAQGLWRAVLWLVAAAGLLLPFCALLSPAVRSNPSTVARIATVILAAQLLQTFWLVLPGQTGSAVMQVLGGVAGVSDRPRVERMATDGKAYAMTNYEVRDVSFRTIGWSAVGLTATVAIVFAATFGLFTLFAHRRPPDTASSLEKAAVIPPSPRLQSNPPADVEGYLSAVTQRLNSTGWIDRGRGIAHIPIDEAMTRLAQQGWPTLDADAGVRPMPGVR